MFRQLTVLAAVFAAAAAGFVAYGPDGVARGCLFPTACVDRAADLFTNHTRVHWASGDVFDRAIPSAPLADLLFVANGSFAACTINTDDDGVTINPSPMTHGAIRAVLRRGVWMPLQNISSTRMFIAAGPSVPRVVMIDGKGVMRRAEYQDYSFKVHTDGVELLRAELEDAGLL